jgi:hypothetical protein
MKSRLLAMRPETKLQPIQRSWIGCTQVAAPNSARNRAEERGFPMPFVDTNGLEVVERLPGWKGRYFHSASMTFAHYELAAGSSIHEHFHPEEEVYEVIEGELEVIIDGRSQVVMSGGWPEACALMALHVVVWAICMLQIGFTRGTSPLLLDFQAMRFTMG